MRKLRAFLTLALFSNLALADPSQVIGIWKNIDDGEILIFEPNGVLSSCYPSTDKRLAIKGVWSEPVAGRFKLKFTHSAVANCASGVVAPSPMQEEISGIAMVSPTELSVFTSGEGPPDRYVRTDRAM